MSRRRATPPSRGWWVAMAVVVAVILWITLRPDHLPGFDTGTNWKPLDHHGRALRALRGDPANREVILYYLVTDVLGNVLLFIPLGLSAAGALGGRTPARRLAGAVGFGLVLSAAVEGIQLLVPGRATDVDDVIFNGLGALLGATALVVGERVARGRKRRRTGRR